MTGQIVDIILILVMVVSGPLGFVIGYSYSKIKKFRPNTELEISAREILLLAAKAAKESDNGTVAIGYEWLLDKAEMVRQLEEAIHQYEVSQ